MDESSVYNESDLAPFRRRLNDLHSIIKSDSESGKHSEAMTKLLERQLGDCGSFHPSLFTHYLPHLISRVQSLYSAGCKTISPYCLLNSYLFTSDSSPFGESLLHWPPKAVHPRRSLNPCKKNCVKLTR
jgi:hypothetical protein